MSTSIFKINIQNDLFVSEDFYDEEKKQVSSLSTSEEFIFNKINIDNLTVESFIDVLDFMESTKCLFLVNKTSDRFINIMTYINDKVTLDIVIFNTVEKKFLLNTSEYKIQEIKFTYRATIDLIERLNHSYNALNSGIYDLKERVNIKHIVVDNPDMIDLLDESLLLNTNINSLIISNRKFKQSNTAHLFSKFITKNEFSSFITKKNFRSIDINHEQERLTNFYKNGNLNYVKGLPKDINRYLTNGKLHAIFIKDNNIYMDSDYKLYLSDDLSINIYDLLNKISNLNIICTTNERFIRNYFIANAISNYYKEDLIFITPLTYGFFEPVDEGFINTDYEYCIGFIQNNEKYYIHNFFKNKTFKVSKKILMLFEGIIKNNSLDITEEKLNKLKDMLKNVQ
ncbi:TPA: hypothetical protein QE963_002682 [Staphylococcus aureus]|nr:hypothetical protein [Staphylococcus aureus]